jgi:hypothetical protein
VTVNHLAQPSGVRIPLPAPQIEALYMLELIATMVNMNCPTCDKPMRKVRWEITNNFKTGKDFKEYDKFTYECKEDDIWVTTEIPVAGKPSTKSLK